MKSENPSLDESLLYYKIHIGSFSVSRYSLHPTDSKLILSIQTVFSLTYLQHQAPAPSSAKDEYDYIRLIYEGYK